MKWSLLFFSFLFSVLTWAEVPERLYLNTAPPVALPNSARYMVYLETSENPVGRRSPRPFWIEHLEIPLRYLQEDKGERLDRRVHESMLFTNDQGEKTVRWILNPEDTTYGDQIIEKFREMGVNLQRKRYFIGYSTSSRSCIVQDPRSGTTFSIKSSTDNTAGSWNDKKETVRAARAGRLMSDHIDRSRHEAHNTSLALVHEPLAYYLNGVDQGIIVRQYDHFLRRSQDLKLVPVFAYVHRAEFYARKAGSAGPVQDFIERTLVQPGGVATAELFLHYGIVYNSPHGQNFLVEVDKDEKPTGKLYARDYADSHLFEPIFSRTDHGRAVLEHYRTFTGNHNQILTETIPLRFGPYHNGSFDKPSWVTNEQNLIDRFKSSLLTRISTTVRYATGTPAALASTYSSYVNYWQENINLQDNAALKQWVEHPVYSEPAPPPVRPPRTEIRPPRPPAAPAPAAHSCRVLFAS